MHTVRYCIGTSLLLMCETFCLVSSIILKNYRVTDTQNLVQIVAALQFNQVRYSKCRNVSRRAVRSSLKRTFFKPI